MPSDPPAAPRSSSAGSGPDPLAERYGRRPGGERAWYRRPLPLLAAVVGALLLVSYGVWVAVAQTRGPAITNIGYQVLDDRTATVRFAVTREPGTAVRCTVHALDVSSAEVGLAQVDVPAGAEREVQRTVRLRTTGRADTAEAVSCARADG